MLTMNDVDTRTLYKKRKVREYSHAHTLAYRVATSQHRLLLVLNDKATLNKEQNTLKSGIRLLQSQEIR